jgi:enoyl-CoA hydratase/carnithine racemase
MASVEVAFANGVHTLTMTGTGVFNDVSLAAFNAALDGALHNNDAQVLLITGEDKNFSQGLDLDYLMSVNDPELAMAFTEHCLRMVGRLLTFPLPVASAVNGHAFGLGAMITLASDYKVMREDRGYFCLPEIDLGMTLTYRMNALVSGKLKGNVLRDVLLTGKKIAGPEAAHRGIVDAAAPADEVVDVVLELASPMRGKHRDALAGLKRGINGDILELIQSEAPDDTIAAGV